MAKYSKRVYRNGAVTVTETKVWLGPVLQARMLVAMGKAVVVMGMTTAAFAKEFAHVGAGTAIPGTLRRSIHSVSVNHDGSNDQQNAASADLPNAGLEDVTGQEKFSPMLLVGSWVDYACVEESGRGHRFIQPAIEQLRGEASAIMLAAFKSEGL